LELQAIALARAYYPDAIVTDLSMPGMDGLEATRRIREQPAIGNVPVIAYTAHPSAAEREPGLFTDVCLKSGSTELLLDKLAHVLV
jgi:CheY-like chemotaxis protein